MGSDYLYTDGGAHYLSPFYSPDLKSWGLDLPFTHAFFVIWAPLGFRATCYYYRKAYYRSFFLSPPACAVAGPQRGRYRGEAAMPFILQNAHRYFLYAGDVVLGFLWYDAGRAFFFRGADGSLEFGIGLGTLVLRGQRRAADAVHVRLQLAPPPGRRAARLLHLLGRHADAPPASGAASACSTSGTWSGRGSASPGSPSTDLYIRLASAGVFHDPRIF